MQQKVNHNPFNGSEVWANKTILRQNYSPEKYPGYSDDPELGADQNESYQLLVNVDTGEGLVIRENR